MPAETVPIALELEIPLTVVHELVKQHLLASLPTHSNGHVSSHGHGPHPQEKEEAAPVLPSRTGAP
jgi:hypothetical protein